MDEEIRGLPHSARAGEFPSTHWSVVLAAGQSSDALASDALEQLCCNYWYPLYAYVRRRGYSSVDAEDLTQEFFARLLAGDFLARADPQKGKFRSFLLAGISYLLSDERDKAHCLKRGAGQKLISFDQKEAEARYCLEPADEMTPERLFERSWIATLLERAAVRLREEYLSSGKTELYEQLTRFRLDVAGQPSYRETAAELGQSVSAMKSAILRMRRRHQQIVREEISHTVADPARVDEEIRHLLMVLE